MIRKGLKPASLISNKYNLYYSKPKTCKMTLVHSILKNNYFNNCLFFFHSRENKIVVFSNLPIIDSLVKIITSQLQDYISFEDVFCFAREKHAEVLGNLLRKYQPSYCIYFGNQKESEESCKGVSFLFLS